MFLTNKWRKKNIKENGKDFFLWNPWLFTTKIGYLRKRKERARYTWYFQLVVVHKGFEVEKRSSKFKAVVESAIRVLPFYGIKRKSKGTSIRILLGVRHENKYNASIARRTHVKARVFANENDMLFWLT